MKKIQFKSALGLAVLATFGTLAMAGCGKATLDSSKSKQLGSEAAAIAAKTCSSVGKTIQGFIPDSPLQMALGEYGGMLAAVKQGGGITEQFFSLKLGTIVENGQTFLVQDFHSTGPIGNYDFSSCAIPGTATHPAISIEDTTYNFVSPTNILPTLSGNVPTALEIIVALKNDGSYDQVFSELHLRDCSKAPSPASGCFTATDLTSAYFSSFVKL
jgi:hypothetical protein